MLAALLVLVKSFFFRRAMGVSRVYLRLRQNNHSHSLSAYCLIVTPRWGQRIRSHGFAGLVRGWLSRRRGREEENSGFLPQKEDLLPAAALSAGARRVSRRWPIVRLPILFCPSKR